MICTGCPFAPRSLALAPAAVPPSSYVYGDSGDGEPLHHRVSVRRVFDESAEDALARDIAALLPLVTVMEPGASDRLRWWRVQAASWTACRPASRSMLIEQAAHFATLRLSRRQVHDIVHSVLRRKRIAIDPLRDFPLVRDGS